MSSSQGQNDKAKTKDTIFVVLEDYITGIGSIIVDLLSIYCYYYAIQYIMHFSLTKA